MVDTTAQIHNIGVNTEISHAIALSDGNLFIYLSIIIYTILPSSHIAIAIFWMQYKCAMLS